MSDGIKVFVGNLPDRCPESSLQDLFSPYGKIKNIIMVKSYAFIHFESENDARRAVEDLHKTKLLGKELTVEIAKNKIPPKKGPSMDRRSKNTGLSNPRNGPQPTIGGAGGILGMGPGSVQNNTLPNAALGLFAANALNSVKNAVSGIPNSSNMQQQNNRDASRERPPPSDGFVIYERFYVDRSHPLLKGLPVPELPRVQDVLATRDPYKNKDPYAQDVSIRDDPYANTTTRNEDFGGGYGNRRDEPSNTRDDYFSSRRDDPYANSRDNHDNFRERSPLYNRRDYDRGDNRGRVGYDDYDRR